MALIDYCTFANVQALISQLQIGVSGTRPTQAEVEIWIAEATAQIDGALASADYPTQLDVLIYPASFSILTNLCAMEVASRAIMVSQYAMDPANSDQAAFYHEQFESGIKKIGRMTNFLYEIAGEGVGGGGRLRSLPTDDSAKDRTPWFTTDQEF